MSQSAELGALPTLRAATDPTAQEAAESTVPMGSVGPAGIRKSLHQADSRTIRTSKSGLWTVSEELTGVTYPV